MTLNAWIIHLDRARDRQAQVQRLIATAPCKAQIIPAVDAKQLSHSDIEKVLFKHSIHAPEYRFPVSNGEVACFLSHRAVWQKIVESGAPMGMIYEDDTALDPEIHTAAVALAKDHIEALGIIMFQPRNIQTAADSVASQNGLHLTRPHVSPLRTNATLYSASAARRMLEVTKVFDRPVDGTLQLHWVTGLRAGIVQPSGVSEVSADLGGTTIQAKPRGLAERLHREFWRPVYRRQIANAAAHWRKRQDT